MDIMQIVQSWLKNFSSFKVSNLKLSTNVILLEIRNRSLNLLLLLQKDFEFPEKDTIFQQIFTLSRRFLKCKNIQQISYI